MGLPRKRIHATYLNAVERWQSGLTRTPGKREYPKKYRGFESPPLRHSGKDASFIA